MQAPKRDKHANKLDVRKYVKKAPKGLKQKREKNQFYFQGFYERLKNLDMKQGHSMDLFMQFDTLIDTQDQEVLEDQLQSNLISLMRTEKMNNRTLDFKKVFEEIEPLCYSHALIVINKGKIIKKMLAFFKLGEDTEGQSSSMKANDTVIKGKVLELLIALIKDLRTDVYQDFKEQIMPAAIQIIDIQNLSVMDSVFTLFSFCFKYLLKPIREDLEDFYSIFQEIIVHKNKHLRHFSSQCLSYVLRKVEITEPLMTMLIQPIWRTEQEGEEIGPYQTIHLLQGISDALFEVMYGANEDLHSKATVVLQTLFAVRKSTKQDADRIDRMIRFLMIKLINGIDVAKQLPLIECLHKELIMNEDEASFEATVTLGINVYQDMLMLKLGRRISTVSVIHMYDSFKQLLQKKKGETVRKTFKASSHALIAKALSYLYYFKNQAINQIFQSSQLDISTSKNVFTTNLNKFCPGQQEAFFGIFVSGPKNIESNPEGLGIDMTFGTLLNIRTSNASQIEFTQESHTLKFKMLFPSFKRQVFQSIQTDQSEIFDLMSIYNCLVSQIEVGKDDFKLDKVDMQERLEKLLEFTSESLQKYTILNFARNIQVKLRLKKQEAFPQLDLDLKSCVKGNLVLTSYGVDVPELENRVKSLFAFDNLSFENDVLYHASLISEESISVKRLLENPSNILLLRLFEAQHKDTTFSFKEHKKLADALASNLLKNSGTLRQQSLSILSKFEALNYEKPQDPEQEVSEVYIDKPCQCIELMLHFESQEISFGTERIKETILETLEVVMKSGLVPSVYFNIVYNFLVGCFWIKYTLIFDHVNNCIGALIRNLEMQEKEEYVKRHTHIMQTVMWLTQMEGHDNDKLTAFLIEKLNKKMIIGEDAMTKAYVMDTRVEELFIETKDFFHQMCRCVGSMLGSVILPKKQLREPVFDLFFNFLDKEYKPLHHHRSDLKGEDMTLVERMTHSNMMDSDTNKAFRRQSYSTLSSFFDMFKRSESLRQAPRIGELQELLLDCLRSSDSKLQKCSLECLIKSGYKNGLVVKYKKLLEGFCDDEKFKDMIPILIHGSHARINDTDIAEEYKNETEDKATSKAIRKETKSLIPKLDDEDRQNMLPVIIKLLQSKMQIKKGAINKKSLFTRRNIVYQFFSDLNPETEFGFFLSELLRPINLSMEDTDVEVILKKLSCVSFNVFLTFINTFEVVMKQMGTLINHYMPTLSKILVQGLLRLSHMFIQDMKNEEMADEASDQEQGQGMYYMAKKQSKDSYRKGLGLVKAIFRKFSYNEGFIKSFSDIVYSEIIKEQLGTLNTNYISDKSQLIEVITVNWLDHLYTLDNFTRYPDVLPAILGMLQHPSINIDVALLHMGMLKKMLMETIDTSQIQGRSLKQHLEPELQEINELKQESSDDDEDTQMKDEQLLEQMKLERKEKCVLLIQNNIQCISKNIHAYWTNHAHDIRHSLSTKGVRGKLQKKNLSTREAQNLKHLEQVKKFQVAKDLLFIQSELSAQLPEDSEINVEFLDMIVEVLAIRNIHNPFLHHDDLLIFAAKSLIQMIPKVKKGSLNLETIDKILQLFMLMNLVKARNIVGNGLVEVLGKGSKHAGILGQKPLELIKGLNKLRRGVADMELDSDNVIVSIKTFITDQESSETSFSALDASGISYNILYLIKNEEYSVREYAEFAFAMLMKKIKDLERKEQLKLAQLIENQIVSSFLHTVKDEMALKTVLKCLQLFILAMKEGDIETRHNIKSIVSLCSPKDETVDFFVNCLSIKLKERQRSMKILKAKLESGEFKDCIKTIQHAIMPIIEYLVFGGSDQFKNRRDTISYERNQKQTTLDEGLSIYTAFAAQLHWPGYFALLKKMLFKLQLVGNQRRSVSAHGEPELQKEKIITKAICKILDGFHFDDVKDVITEMEKANGFRMEEKAKSDTLWNSDFSDLLRKQLEEEEEEVKEEKEDEEKVEGEGQEDQEEKEESDHEMPADEEMEVIGTKMSEEMVRDIQFKLYTKVLPVLENHLTESSDRHTVRSFVTVCYAKLIRKLPAKRFNMKLQKLVNMIVVKGLKSKDLSHREKSRKSLVKLLEEISPRFLSVVFDEMKSNLTQGYMQHVYLFSIHNLLSCLMAQNKLKPGSISGKTININIEILLSELFGEIGDEKNTADHQRKIIKESKAKKAIPIFEIMAQFCDFQTTFMNLLAPIINTLETSPGFNKIQQCEDLLSRVSSSLLKNETVKGSQLLLFLYSIVDRGINLATKIKINDEKEKRDYGAVLDKSIQHRSKIEQKEMSLKIEMHWKKGNQSLDQKKTQEISGRILASFGLQCLKKTLKNKEILTLECDTVKDEEKNDKQKEEMLQRLDPFVYLILNSFKTYHTPIVVTSLNIMTQIIGLGLPSFKQLLKKFLNRIFKLFQTTQNSDSDFLNSLFKCTSELIKTYAIYQDLSDIQIKTLLEIIKSHMAKFQVQNNALQCLRSVVFRRFESAALYDLVEEIQEIMVFNTSSSIRGICQNIFTQFLLDYPLAPERVEQHINFVIKNLGCKRYEGRLQLLDVLKGLFEKLPSDILDLYCELMFFTLLLRAVNDENTKCRIQVQTTMKALVFSPKINQAKVKTLLNTVLKMGSDQPGKKEMLQMAKMNAFQMLVQSGSDSGNVTMKLKKDECQQIMESVYFSVIKVQVEELEQKLEAQKKRLGEQDDSDEDDPKIKSFLQAISLDDDEEQNKIMEEDAEQEPEVDQNKPWCLLYHALACVERLIENQDKKIVAASIMKLQLSKSILFIAQHSTNYFIRMVSQRLLGHLFACQIELKLNLPQLLNLEIPEQLEELTYDLVNCLYQPSQTEEMSNQIVKNLLFMLQALLDQPSAVQNKLKYDKIFKKISYIGRKVMLDIRTSQDKLESILQFFFLSSQLLIVSDGHKLILEEVCGPMLELVYRTYTDDQYLRGSKVKDLSFEIVEFLQTHVDKPSFIETYSQVKTSILEKRNSRRMQHKQLVGSMEGMEMRKNKRVKKMEKKKAKKQDKIFKYKLTS